MSRAARAEEWTGALAEAGLPITFTYPVLEIAVRELIGLAILAAGMSMVSQSGAVQLAAGIAISFFGGLVAGSNLRAMLDQEWRRIVVDRNGVEVRYGFSHRRYPFPRLLGIPNLADRIPPIPDRTSAGCGADAWPERYQKPGHNLRPAGLYLPRSVV
jgi:hypothetical protein